MITRAKFENFKALRDVQITFDSRLTVLVGPNGSGKTSVLEAIQFLGKYALQNRDPEPFGIATPLGSMPAYGWSADPHTVFDESALRGARFEVVCGSQSGPEVICRYSNKREGEAQRHGFQFLEGGKLISGMLPQLAQIRSATLLRLDPAHLRYPSSPRSIPPETAPSGSGLASTLAYMLRKYPEKFQAITDALRRVIPNVLRIRLDLEPFSGQFGDVLLFDFRGVSAVPARSASDGTLIVLGLLTAIIASDGPKLILLDDLDHRLHPKAQMDLVGLIRELLDQFPDLQIIATAHSPYILDKLKPNEVRVMALKDDGSAVCKPITDHPDFERWKESMSPGEFWSTFYEDWLSKSRTPQPVP